MNPFTESTVAVPAVADQYGAWPEPEAELLPLSGLAAESPMSPGPEAESPMSPGTTLKKAVMRAGVCLVLLGSAFANTVYAVDVNAADVSQLEGIKGIGPKTARTIIEERARGGRYESFDDLSDRVKGIGPAKVASLRSAGLTVQGGLNAAEPAGREKSPVNAVAPKGGHKIR